MPFLLRSFIIFGLNLSFVESLQSHFMLTISHWSSGLPVCFMSQGTQVQIPSGVLMWNRDSPVSDVSLHLSRYPDVYYWGLHISIHAAEVNFYVLGADGPAPVKNLLKTIFHPRTVTFWILSPEQGNFRKQRLLRYRLALVKTTTNLLLVTGPT